MREPPSISSFASRAKVLGLQETEAIRGTLERASSWHCSRAPARGGSSTIASKRLRSCPSSGLRQKSRCSTKAGRLAQLAVHFKRRPVYHAPAHPARRAKQTTRRGQ